jgi:4'-phosphopantetheinyl transferase EntD
MPTFETVVERSYRGRMEKLKAVLIDIVPPAIEVVERIIPDVGAGLFEQEKAALGLVSADRRHEFTQARACAHRALIQLGSPASPIVLGSHREPIWPEGIIGSITHCRGYWAAAVAKRGDMISFGIDAEPHEVSGPSILENITRPAEREALKSLAGVGVLWELVILSAKECVYKAWFPVTRYWLDFMDVEISFEEPMFFRAEVLVGSKLSHFTRRQFSGRYLVNKGFVFTFVQITRST